MALGAIAEADRHNIRGERISVDTIPLVGEEPLASAVRAVVRLPRVRLLVRPKAGPAFRLDEVDEAAADRVLILLSRSS